MCDADNDNVPTTDTPAKPKWREDNPDLAAASAELVNRHRKEMAVVERAEGKACRKAGRNATIRQHIGEGWDGEPDNDNIGWPLAKALKTDGKEHLLRAAMEYRRIEASANSGALLNGSKPESDYVSIDHESTIMEDGSIAYGKVRRSRSAEAIGSTPSRRSNAANEATMHPSSPAAKKWNGDVPVINMLDDKRRLARLHIALGPLVKPFEDAVVCGETLEAVGRASGARNKMSASGAGKALVITGLYAVQEELSRIHRDESEPARRAA